FARSGLIKRNELARSAKRSSTAKLVKLFNSEAGQALQQRSWSSSSTAQLVKLFSKSCPSTGSG
ncbi:MAG: hypothetical protein LH470_12135, partial [Lysobacter sp.]|nr:hypothetical protein [Lysobacter sp.]